MVWSVVTVSVGFASARQYFFYTYITVAEKGNLVIGLARDPATFKTAQKKASQSSKITIILIVNCSQGIPITLIQLKVSGIY